MLSNLTCTKVYDPFIGPFNVHYMLVVQTAWDCMVVASCIYYLSTYASLLFLQLNLATILQVVLLMFAYQLLLSSVSSCLLSCASVQAASVQSSLHFAHLAQCQTKSTMLHSRHWQFPWITATE